MWQIARLTVSTLGLLLLTGLAYGSQVFVNGNFASGSISPWTDDTRYGTGTGWSITSSGCYNGSYCVIDTGNVGLEQTFAGVATTSITDVSFYEMTAAGDAAVDFFYQGGGDDEFLVPPTTSYGAWGFFDATSDLRPSGTLVGFEVFGNSLSSPSQLDDLSLTTNVATPEPGTGLLSTLVLTAVLLGYKRIRQT